MKTPQKVVLAILLSVPNGAFGGEKADPLIWIFECRPSSEEHEFRVQGMAVSVSRERTTAFLAVQERTEQAMALQGERETRK